MESMLKREKKLVIFDMDGLMIDSEKLTCRIFAQVLCDMGYQGYDEEMHSTLMGRNQCSIRRKMKDKYGEDFPYEAFWKESHRILDAQLFEHVDKKAGLDELLQFLLGNHYKLAVASGSDHPRVEKILRRAGVHDLFDAIICGDEVQNCKPAPDIFLKACEKTRIPPESALVLEDSEAGILAAYRGEIDVICVPDLKYPGKPYCDMTCAVVGSLYDVIGVLS